MSHFIESVAFINQTFMNLELHNERVNKTQKEFFGITQPFFLEKAIEIPQNLQKNQWYKCRMIYAENIVEVKFELYQPKKIESVELVFDNQIDYSFKFKNRTVFENHLNQSPCDEMIIVKNGFITDSSYSNLIFFDGKNWITPKTYLLNGTQRQYLLKKKMITEKEIQVSDLPNFSHFKLINSMLTFENSSILEISIINTPNAFTQS